MTIAVSAPGGSDRIGHKRLVVVFGEHPATDADCIAECLRRIYAVQVPVRSGTGSIRRVNVKAAPRQSERDIYLFLSGVSCPGRRPAGRPAARPWAR